jgi:hypothetical protein
MWADLIAIHCHHYRSSHDTCHMTPYVEDHDHSMLFGYMSSLSLTSYERAPLWPNWCYNRQTLYTPARRNQHLCCLCNICLPWPIISVLYTFSLLILAHKPPLSLSHWLYISTTSLSLLPNRNTSHVTHHLFIPVPFPYGEAGISLALRHSHTIGK